MNSGVIDQPAACVWCNVKPVADGLLWGCDDCTYVCACCVESKPFENGNDINEVCDDCEAYYVDGWTTCECCGEMNVLIVGGMAAEYCDACEGAREGE